MTNQYYSTVPHIFGRNRPPVINSYDILQLEAAMLDTLTDMEVGNKIMKIKDEDAKDAEQVALLDQRFNQLNLEETTPLDPSSQEFEILKNYLINTTGHTHNIQYRLQDIFRIERKGEADRFTNSAFAKRKDSKRLLLWHGSRTTNFGGILSQGLRIAPKEAPVNGYAFGKGVYLADMSTKSANYCVSGSSGGHGLLLLCEAELGNPMYELLKGDPTAEEKCKQAKCISTRGNGKTVPHGWVDAGAVHESLEGVMMVCALPCSLLNNERGKANQKYSPILQSRLPIKSYLRAPIYNITSTSPTTSLRYVCATCCALQSSRRRVKRLVKRALQHSTGRFRADSHELGSYLSNFGAISQGVHVSLQVASASHLRSQEACMH